MSITACSRVGGTLHDALATWQAKADGKAVIDYGFHLAVTDLNDRGDGRAAGDGRGRASPASSASWPTRASSRSTTPPYSRCWSRRASLGALVNVHAENGDVVDLLIKRFVAEGMLTPAVPRRQPPAGGGGRGHPSRRGPGRIGARAAERGAYDLHEASVRQWWRRARAASCTSTARPARSTCC